MSREYRLELAPHANQTHLYKDGQELEFIVGLNLVVLPGQDGFLEYEVCPLDAELDDSEFYRIPLQNVDIDTF